MLVIMPLANTLLFTPIMDHLRVFFQLFRLQQLLSVFWDDKTTRKHMRNDGLYWCSGPHPMPKRGRSIPLGLRPGLQRGGGHTRIGRFQQMLTQL
jgi:hypothetical protein